MGEMYEYLHDVFIGGLSLEDGGVIADNTRVISGIRFRQQRVGVGEAASCTVPDFAVNWTRKEDILCYPPFNRYSKSTESFGPCGDMGVIPEQVSYNSESVHLPVTGLGPCDTPPIDDGLETDYSGLPNTQRRWRYTEEWFGVSTPGQIPGVSYPAGGFSIYVGLSEANLTAAVAEMEAENWVDDQTRVNIVEFLAYNPNYNMFVFIKVLFEFDANGVCFPSVQYAPMVLETAETDYFYQVSKVIYCIYIAYFYFKFFKEMANAK